MRATSVPGFYENVDGSFMDLQSALALTPEEIAKQLTKEAALQLLAAVHKLAGETQH